MHALVHRSFFAKFVGVCVCVCVFLCLIITTRCVTTNILLKLSASFGTQLAVGANREILFTIFTKQTSILAANKHWTERMTACVCVGMCVDVCEPKKRNKTNGVRCEVFARRAFVGQII